jgi:hypothetical protein
MFHLCLHSQAGSRRLSPARLNVLQSESLLLRIPVKRRKSPQFSSNAGSHMGPLRGRQKGIGYGALRGENRLNDLRQSAAVLDTGE